MQPKNIMFSLVILFISMVALSQCAQVLVIMPSLNFLTLVGGTQVQVGYYLDEFYWTAQALVNAGYTLDVVTPEGIVMYEYKSGCIITLKFSFFAWSDR